MLIKLEGYQLVHAAQDYIKKEYGVDMNVDAESIEAWVNIDHQQNEYKRNKDYTLKRNNKGDLILDKEKSKRIEASYPAQYSVTMELYLQPSSKKEDS